MDIESFAQLVSQWLDQRDDEALCARVDSAASRDPVLAQVRDEWLRFDATLRRACPDISDSVNWSRLNARVVERIEALDSQPLAASSLRDATDVRDRVDWNKLRGRVMRAVAADCGNVSHRSAFGGRRRLALTFLSAAAACLLALYFYPGQPAQTLRGVAQVRVTGLDIDNNAENSASAFSSVSISAPPDSGSPAPVQVAADQPRVAELFLMIEPPRASNGAAMPGSPAGFN